MTKIHDLQDARDEFKRLKALDKTAKRLVLSALGAVGVSFTTAVVLNNGNWMALLIPSLITLTVGIMLWRYLNVGRPDRLTDARRDLRKAERAFEEEATQPPPRPTPTEKQFDEWHTHHRERF